MGVQSLDLMRQAVPKVETLEWRRATQTKGMRLPDTILYIYIYKSIQIYTYIYSIRLSINMKSQNV